MPSGLATITLPCNPNANESDVFGVGGNAEAIRPWLCITAGDYNRVYEAQAAEREKAFDWCCKLRPRSSEAGSIKKERAF